MKHLVIIGTVFPEPNSTAAGKRMMQLIDVFQEHNFRITFLSAASVTEYSFDGTSRNIDVQTIFLNDASFESLIQKLNPDIVLFDRFVSEEQFGWKVSEMCPNAVKILDTEDLHFLRKAREKAFKENKEWHDDFLLNDIFKREIASILRCDISLIISEFEFQVLTEKFKIQEEILFYIPFISDKIEKNRSNFHNRKNLVSIGNFLHEPNWQTVLKLKELWKKLRKKLPDAQLHIYGSYANEKVFGLHNEKEGFMVKGRADAVENVFSDYRVLLAPIPFGAGLKGKLWESMIYGIPNVTTSVGAEAMHKNMDWNGFIEDSDEEFIEKAVLLYQNEEIWNLSKKNGYQILEKLFCKKDFEPNLIKKINEILEHLSEHRNRNFLGQILQHHTVQSTKFMSKWIEEKNKH